MANWQSVSGQKDRARVKIDGRPTTAARHFGPRFKAAENELLYSKEDYRRTPKAGADHSIGRTGRGEERPGDKKARCAIERLRFERLLNTGARGKIAPFLPVRCAWGSMALRITTQARGRCFPCVQRLDLGAGSQELLRR